MMTNSKQTTTKNGTVVDVNARVLTPMLITARRRLHGERDARIERELLHLALRWRAISLSEFLQASFSPSTRRYIRSRRLQA